MMHSIYDVKLAISKDKEAFEKLLIAEEEKLYFTALSYVKNKDDALDAIQEAVCQAYLSIHQLKQPEYFSTWLIRILIRECYKLLKKKERMIPFEENELLKRIDYKMTNAHSSQELKELVYELDEPYHSVLILFYYHDLSLKQISETMNIPLNTVKTHLRRGKKQLKKQLERSEYYEKII
ncbi:sigma-70 family RNA polymerase sigma factor [Alkalicoccobacillus porphyridii]|uniref:Sigma-70 family RNA polymerase sigma factor n=1 Tax=Alkalicoccobacillus porphyridii TaxID=2597270 RepID=A0A553ZWL2_9BACI|nr:sigma-70 family RNA polymerase sigma factor [Alkalicoccobacillus porphyridii]TSB45745.1 sigma-70 family RNA polymerase sigma factor [Alkalicoccobacillus porphyridii]